MVVLFSPFPSWIQVFIDDRCIPIFAIFISIPDSSRMSLVLWLLFYHYTQYRPNKKKDKFRRKKVLNYFKAFTSVVTTYFNSQMHNKLTYPELLQQKKTFSNKLKALVNSPFLTLRVRKVFAFPIED